MEGPSDISFRGLDSFWSLMHRSHLTIRTAYDTALLTTDVALEQCTSYFHDAMIKQPDKSKLGKDSTYFGSQFQKTRVHIGRESIVERTGNRNDIQSHTGVNPPAIFLNRTM